MRRLIGILLALCLFTYFGSPSLSAKAESGRTVDIPISSLNSDQPVQLTGLFSSQKLDFTLPNNWQVTDESWVDLTLTLSNLIDQTDSSLTISLNGLQVTSLLLKDLAGQGQRIKIPGSFFTSGKNTLALDGVLYLPDDAKTNCKGWDNPSRWATFNPTSSLHIGFQTQSFPADLSNFPDSFLEPLDRYLPDGEGQTLFVLPDRVQPDDLKALSATAYYLGHQAGDKFIWNPQIVTARQFKQLPKVNSNIIFVDNQPPGFENMISSTKNGVGIFTSPWNQSKAIMIISDHNRQDGYTPALVFGDFIKKVLLSGNTAYFDSTAEPKPTAFNNTFTLEDLGYLDRTVRNVGKENLIYRFMLPYSVEPISGDLLLEITHAPDLDLNTSSIAVVLNGYTVASVLPATQNTRADPIQISLPTKHLRPGINFLRLAFDFHLQYSSCEKAPDTIWATVFNSSSFKFTTRKRTGVPTLKDFPAAFDEYPGASFVVPDLPNLQMLTNVSKLIFNMGATSYYGNEPPNLMTASSYTVNSVKDQNYILVGLPSKNAAIEDINQFLPQPFTLNTDQLQQGYGVYLPNPNTRASLGLIQITPSPWYKSGTIMILTGTSPQGLDWAWNATLDPSLRSQFSGNLMIVGPAQGLAPGSASSQSGNLLFEQTPMVVRLPIIGRFLQQNGQSEEAIALMAIAIAGLVTWLAVKGTPWLTRIEIRLKHTADATEKERE